MGRISTCATLGAMLLMLGCAATAGDLPAPGERIIANTILFSIARVEHHAH